MSVWHHGRTQAWAAGVEGVEVVKKHLILPTNITLWENAQVLNSRPRDYHILQDCRGTNLSSGKRPNTGSLKCPSGKKSRSYCQESQDWNSLLVASLLSSYLFSLFTGPCRSEENAEMGCAAPDRVSVAPLKSTGL